MNESADTEKSWKLRVASMEGELNAIRTTNVAIYDETIKSTKIFQVLVIILGLTAGYFTIWSTDRVDKTISQAEHRIASLSGGFIPQSARIQSVAKDNKLFVTLYIKKGDAFGLNGYRVYGQASAEIVIEGDVPGKMLGFQVAMNGEFIDEVLKKAISDQSTELEFKRFKYFSMTNSAEGVLLPPDIPYPITYLFSFFFKSCEDAKQFSDFAVKEKLKLTTLLRPVLIDSRKVAKSSEFEVTLINLASQYDCQVEVSRYEKPNS